MIKPSLSLLITLHYLSQTHNIFYKNYTLICTSKQNQRDLTYEDNAFNPTTPTTINITLTTLPTLFDSPKNNMLITAAPAVPIPIQTAYAELTCKNLKE